MSSMLKKTGGLAFKPKAFSRRGTVGATSGASSQTATTATSADTTRAPTAEPQQPTTDAPSLTPPATLPPSHDSVATPGAAVENRNPAPQTSSVTRVFPPTPDPSQPSATSSAPKTIASSTTRSRAPRQQEARSDPGVTQAVQVPDAVAASDADNTAADRLFVEDTYPRAEEGAPTVAGPVTASSTPTLPAVGATTVSDAPEVQAPPAANAAPKKKRAYTRRKPRESGQEGAQSTFLDGEAPPPRKRAKTPRRKRTTTTDGEAATEDGATVADGDSRATPKPSKRRRRSPTPEDAVNVKVDHTAVKMSELTRDLGIGVPFKHAEAIAERAREARNRARQRKLEKDKIRMGLLPDPGDDIHGSHKRDGSQNTTKNRLGSSAPEGGDAAASESAGPGYIVVDGQIIINQQSLMIDNHASADNDISNMRTVVEDDFTHLTTAASFMRESRVMGANSWTEDETEKFYNYLRMFGTDFETISHMFPGKNRRMVKLKFNREERLRPNRINAAVSPRSGKEVAIDLDHYKERRNNWQEAEEIMKEHDALVAEHNIEVQRLKAERRAQGLADDDDDDVPAAAGAQAGVPGEGDVSNDAEAGDALQDQDLAGEDGIEHNNEEGKTTGYQKNPTAIAAVG